MYRDSNGGYHDTVITELHPLEDYKLWCRLSTGEIKIFDFTPHLELPMFRHLKDKSKFNDVKIVDGVPAWVSAKKGTRDLDMSLAWIVEYGIDASECEEVLGWYAWKKSGKPLPNSLQTS